MKIAHGLAETLEQLEAEPAEFRDAARDFLDGAGQPRRARRRPARRRPRRDEGALPGPLVRARARLRAVRRDDRRDRRVRAAGARRVGGRLPRRRDGRLRAHAGRRARVGQQHDQHRHRLRVRRAADGAALAGARARLGARGARRTTSRRGRSSPAAADERPPAFLLDLDDVAGKRIIADAARPHGHDPRGARRRRAGGDEPVRDRPALAGLPAADDGADRRRRSGPTCSSTRTRRSPSSARPASRTVVCEEKHMGSRAIVVVCRDAEVGARALRRATADSARSTRAPGGRSSTTTRPRAGAAPRGASARRGPVGGARDRTGSCSTASCCRGRRRRWS